MAQMVKYLEATEKTISSLPVVTGQLIYTKDSARAFFDSSDNERVEIGNLVVLETEENRTGLENPIPNKLYYVSESSTLYVYDGEWVSANPSYDDVYVSKNGDTVTGDLVVTQTLTANKVVIGDTVLEYDSTNKCLNFVFA